MSWDLLKKIAESLNDDDTSSGADQQKNKVEEEGESPDKKDENKKPEETNDQPNPAPTINTPPATQVGISQIIDFLQQNPNPNDAAVHSFAEQNGIPTEQMEQMIYGLSTKFVNLMRGGKSVDQQLDINSVDPSELEMGMAIESEHSPDPSVQKKITLDHLAEIPDYYSRLRAMEEQAKSESGAAAVPKKDDGYGYMDGQEETKEMDANQPVGAQNRTEL